MWFVSLCKIPIFLELLINLILSNYHLKKLEHEKFDKKIMNLLNTNSTNYKKIEKLGEGSFGEVFLVKNMKDNNLYVSKDISL